MVCKKKTWENHHGDLQIIKNHQHSNESSQICGTMIHWKVVGRSSGGDGISKAPSSLGRTISCLPPMGMANILIPYLYIYIYIYICIYIYIFVFIFICVYTYVYMYTYVYTYVLMTGGWCRWHLFSHFRLCLLRMMFFHHASCSQDLHRRDCALSENSRKLFENPRN